MLDKLSGMITLSGVVLALVRVCSYHRRICHEKSRLSAFQAPIATVAEIDSTSGRGGLN